MVKWTKGYVNYVDLVVTATESSINIANNTSKVIVQAQLYYGGGISAYNANPQTLTMDIDGSRVANKTGITYNLSTGNRTLNLGTWSRTVYHHDDGTKTANVTVKITDGRGDTAVINEGFRLDNIPRVSKLRLSSTTIPLGQVATLTIDRHHYSFTHDVRYEFEGLKGQTSGIATPNGAGTSTTFKPPDSIASRISTKTSGSGRIVVTTKSGSTVIGTSTIGFTVTLPTTSDYDPVVNNPSVTEQNATVRALGAVWVQNQSKIRITASVSTKYSATLKSARVYIGGAWHNAKISGSTATIEKDYTPTTGGTHNYKLEVTDSRGRRGSNGGAITVEAYSKPRMTVSANRNFDDATKIDIRSKLTGSSLGGRNTLTIQIFTKVSTSSSWGTAKKTTPTSTTGILDFGVTTLTGYSEGLSYMVRVISKDSLTTWSEVEIPVSTTPVLMDVYKDIGVSYGKIYNKLLGGSVQIDGHGIPTFGDYTYGKTSSGEYYRFADGTQICTISNLTVRQNHVVRLEATWTYPMPFKGEAIAVANRGGYHGGSSAINSSAPTASSGERTCVVRLWASNGTFSSSDNDVVSVIAVGRWK